MRKKPFKMKGLNFNDVILLLHFSWEHFEEQNLHHDQVYCNRKAIYELQVKDHPNFHEYVL